MDPCSWWGYNACACLCLRHLPIAGAIHPHARLYATWGNFSMQDSPSLLQLTNTSVLLNMALSGGGILASRASMVSVVAGTVALNRALHDGGGLSCQGCNLLRSISLFRKNEAMQVGRLSHCSETVLSCRTDATSAANPVARCPKTLWLKANYCPCVGSWHVCPAWR